MGIAGFCHKNFTNHQKTLQSACSTATNFIYETPEWVVVAAAVGMLGCCIFRRLFSISGCCLGLAASTIATRVFTKVLHYYRPDEMQFFRRKLCDFHSKYGFITYLCSLISHVAALAIYPIAAICVSVVFGAYLGVIAEKKIYKYKRHLQRERLANPVLTPESRINEC